MIPQIAITARDIKITATVENEELFASDTSDVTEIVVDVDVNLLHRKSTLSDYKMTSNASYKTHCFHRL